MTTFIPSQHNHQAAPTAVFSTATLAAAATLATDFYRPLWTGPSGEESSGESVARHLEATNALLGRDGWIRAYDYSNDWSNGADLADDDSMTVEDMLRALLRLVRDEFRTDSRRPLSTALGHVGASGDGGDPDTAAIASDVLNLLVQAHTGSDSARATPWSERLTRTHADITALLAAAQFARTYGPAGTSTQARKPLDKG